MTKRDLLTQLAIQQQQADYWKTQYYAAIFHDAKVIRQIRLDTEKRKA